MSYQPFIDGPGRRNDFVKVNGTIYRIHRIEDFFSGRIGYNSVVVPAFWQVDAQNNLAARGDTTFLNVAITNIAAHRLLQITGLEIWTGSLNLSIRQPARMIRWGAGPAPEGILTGIRSPIGAPIRLRNLFTVNEKPIQMRGVNTSRCKTIAPYVSMRGFIYELTVKDVPKAPQYYYEVPLGGIE